MRGYPYPFECFDLLQIGECHLDLVEPLQNAVTGKRVDNDRMRAQISGQNQFQPSQIDRNLRVWKARQVIGERLTVPGFKSNRYKPVF